MNDGKAISNNTRGIYHLQQSRRTNIAQIPTQSLVVDTNHTNRQKGRAEKKFTNRPFLDIIPNPKDSSSEALQEK